MNPLPNNGGGILIPFHARIIEKFTQTCCNSCNTISRVTNLTSKTSTLTLPYFSVIFKRHVLVLGLSRVI